MADWAAELLDACEPIAAALDPAGGQGAHHEAVAHARAALRDLDSLPSARIVRALVGDGDGHGDYVSLIRGLSVAARQTLLALPWPPELAERYERLAQESLRKQGALEAADHGADFEAFRRRYLSADGLNA